MVRVKNRYLTVVIIFPSTLLPLRNQPQTEASKEANVKRKRHAIRYTRKAASEAVRNNDTIYSNVLNDGGEEDGGGVDGDNVGATTGSKTITPTQIYTSITKVSLTLFGSVTTTVLSQSLQVRSYDSLTQTSEVKVGRDMKDLLCACMAGVRGVGGRECTLVTKGIRGTEVVKKNGTKKNKGKKRKII